MWVRLSSKPSYIEGATALRWGYVWPELQQPQVRKEVTHLYVVVL